MPGDSTNFDPVRFRSRFRFFRERPSCVWLDSAATSLLPDPVLDAFADAASRLHSSVHRSLHTPGVEATRAYENARECVAAFLRAPSPDGLVFTSGATHALNLAARVLVLPALSPSSTLLLSPSAHHSLLLPLREAARLSGAALRLLPLDPSGRIPPDAIPALAPPGRTPWIAVDWLSNVTGAPNDLPALAAAAHSLGARLLVDAAQGIPHLPPDLPAFDCDAFAFSGHKMYAPSGIGALWARPSLLRDAPPLFLGGEMVHSVSADSFLPAPPPQRFEAGTPNVPAAIALAAAADFLASLPPAAHAYVATLAAETRQRILALPGAAVHSSPDSPSLVTFSFPAVHPHDIAQFLDDRAIALRAGYLCAEPYIRSLADAPVLRASYAPYNLPTDPATLTTALSQALQLYA